jgi:hypothetical protein
MEAEAVMSLAVFGGTAAMAWAGAWAWAQWLRHRHDPSAARRVASDQVADARLARIEETMDALAIEIERVAEAQRYTARLLSERLPAAPAASPPRALPAEPPRAITPR